MLHWIFKMFTKELAVAWLFLHACIILSHAREARPPCPLCNSSSGTFTEALADSKWISCLLLCASTKAEPKRSMLPSHTIEGCLYSKKVSHCVRNSQSMSKLFYVRLNLVYSNGSILMIQDSVTYQFFGLICLMCLISTLLSNLISTLCRNNSALQVQICLHPTLLCEWMHQYQFYKADIPTLLCE